MNALLILLFTTAAMGYNPNTGITTYDDPTVLDTSAGQPAPSTATSFPAPMATDSLNPAPASTPQRPSFSTIPEGYRQVPATYTSRGIQSSPAHYLADEELLKLLGFSPTTQQPTIPELRAGQNSPRTVYRDDLNGGTWMPDGSGAFTFRPDSHYGSWFQESVAPNLSNAMTGWGPALAAAGLGGVDLFGDLAAGSAGAAGATEVGAGGAMDMGGSAGVFDSFGNPLYTSPGMLSQMGGLATNFGTNLLTSGGDVRGALKNTAVGAGIGAGANLAADGINSVFAPTNAPSRFGNDVMFDAGLEDQALGDTMKRRFSFDADLNDSSLGAAMSARTPLMPPAVLDTGGRGMMPTPIVDTGGQPMMPTPLAPHSPGMLPSPMPMSAVASTPPSVEAQPSAEQQPQAQAPSPEVVSAKQLVDLSKIGSALAKLNAGRGTPEDAPAPPERQQGETDDQYQQRYEQTLVQYALPSLDAQSLADMGLVPGSPEYLDYVMKQMDDVIAHITDGLDPNDANLSDKLRTKTREELDTLSRVLYARGTLETSMRSGQYKDPFTGISEDVIAPEGQTFNPAVGAYHRGLARSAAEMARMSPEEARHYAGGMLNRAPDLFGEQATHNARTLDEMLSQQNMDPEDIRRRRGMFGQDPFANLGSMSERDLEATLASLLH